MAKIVYRQMPAPWELSQQISKSPRVGANFWCKSPGVQGMVIDEIDNWIMLKSFFNNWKNFQEKN